MEVVPTVDECDLVHDSSNWHRVRPPISEVRCIRVDSHPSIGDLAPILVLGSYVVPIDVNADRTGSKPPSRRKGD